MTHTNVLDSFRLDGKVALVTGAARGLGVTMATALAEAGADVVLSGRSRETCQGAADAIAASTGRRIQAFVADVTKIDDVERLASDAESALGKVDILVNNAGIQHPRRHSAALGSGLGRGDRYQPEGTVPLRPRVRTANGGAGAGDA